MKPSLGLSQSEWHPALEDSIHRSAAGKPTILSEKFLGLHWFSDYPGYSLEPWSDFSMTFEALRQPFSVIDRKNYLKSTLLELIGGLMISPKYVQDHVTLVIDWLRVVFPNFLGPLLRLLCSEWPIYIRGWGYSTVTILAYIALLKGLDRDQVYDKLCLAADYADHGYYGTALRVIEQILNLRSKPAIAQSLGLEHSYDGISCEPTTTENSGAYDPCLTEAARWEELEG